MEAVLLKVDGIRCPETGSFDLELVSPGFMLTRVGRMWLHCGLKGHPAESPTFSCLTLNFSGKLY